MAADDLAARLENAHVNCDDDDTAALLMDALLFVRKAERESADFQGRIDRTLDYASEVLRVANMEPLAAQVLLAVVKSLETPVVCGTEAVRS
jgi:hypothetical protein